jgi:hypothetical protein
MTGDVVTGPDRENRVYAAHVLIRATIARDIYTMERVMARWGSGDQAHAFISALAGAAAALAFFLADQDEGHALDASDRLTDACAQRRSLMQVSGLYGSPGGSKLFGVVAGLWCCTTAPAADLRKGLLRAS